jgi:hypothetical protein
MVTETERVGKKFFKGQAMLLGATTATHVSPKPLLYF